MFVDQILDRIRRYRRLNGYSILGFAKLAGVNEFTLRKIDTPRWNQTLATLRKCEEAIPADFMTAANDTGCPDQAAKADRGDDQTRAALSAADSI